VGKVTGFLEIDRQERKYAPAADRVRHYNEFIIPLSEEGTRNQAARCMDCGIPYCHNGCPVNNQIPDWNDLVYNNWWKRLAQSSPTNTFRLRAAYAPLLRHPTLNMTTIR
jgi:glutamate synthase (NADPH/NADH) small chain